MIATNHRRVKEMEKDRKTCNSPYLAEDRALTNERKTVILTIALRTAMFLYKTINLVWRPVNSS